MTTVHNKTTSEVKPQIMKDKGGWQFTDDLIIRIKNFDTTAIAEFYNANYKIILGMAKKYAWRRKELFGSFYYEVDDLVQQVYIDLPYYNFSSRTRLYRSIVGGSFWLVNDGGISAQRKSYKLIKRSQIVSYDEPLSDKNGDKSTLSLLDRFIRSPSSCDEFFALELCGDRENKDETICAYLEKTITNKKDLNIMFCKLFTDIPLNQIKGDEYEFYRSCKKKIS